MAQKKPARRAAALPHAFSLIIERQEGESYDAWESLILELEPTHIVTRLGDDSIGLTRRAGAAA